MRFAAGKGNQVRPIKDQKHTDVDRKTLMCRLRELIRALDRRVPHPEREGESRIAREAAALRQNADRIADLESTYSSDASRLAKSGTGSGAAGGGFGDGRR